MLYRRCEVNMTHALPTNDGARYFHAALLAYDAAKTNTAIFAAVTFVILLRTKNALVKQTALFRTLGTIVYRFRLCHLSGAPLQNALGACEPHADRVKVLRNCIFFALYSHN